uniref:BRCT domain-containing protein n=1 Tax=Ditylum brightwellii TaxID=49249 RepID=A0A7S4S4T4_9STRA
MPSVTSGRKNNDEVGEEKKDEVERVEERNENSKIAMKSTFASSSPLFQPSSGNDDFPQDQSSQWKVLQNEHSISEETKENSTVLASPSTRGGTPPAPSSKHHPTTPPLGIKRALLPPPSIGCQSHFSPSQESPMSGLITTTATDEQSEPPTEYFPSPPPSTSRTKKKERKRTPSHYSLTQHSLMSKQPPMSYREEQSEPQPKHLPTPPLSQNKNQMMARFSPSQESLTVQHPPSPQREQSEPQSEHFPSPPLSGSGILPARSSLSQESLSSDHPPSPQREQSEPQSEHLPTPPNSLSQLDCSGANHMVGPTSNHTASDMYISKKRQTASPTKESPGSQLSVDCIVEETCLPQLPDPSDVEFGNDAKKENPIFLNVQQRIERDRRPLEVKGKKTFGLHSVGDDDLSSVVYGTATEPNDLIPVCDTDSDIIVRETLVEASESPGTTDLDEMKTSPLASASLCPRRKMSCLESEVEIEADGDPPKYTVEHNLGDETRHTSIQGSGAGLNKENMVYIYYDSLDKAELRVLRRLQKSGLCVLPGTSVHSDFWDNDTESSSVFDNSQHPASIPAAGNTNNGTKTRWFITHAVRKENIFISDCEGDKHKEKSTKSTSADYSNANGNFPSTFRVCHRSFEYLKAITSGMCILDAKVLNDSMETKRWLLSEDLYGISCDLELYDKFLSLSRDQSSLHKWLTSTMQDCHGISKRQLTFFLSDFALFLLPDTESSEDDVACKNEALLRSIQIIDRNSPTHGTDLTDTKERDIPNVEFSSDSSQLTAEQAKTLIRSIGGTVITQENDAMWKFPTGDTRRLIIIPDGISPNQLMAKLVRYCLSPGSILPLDSWVDDYDLRLDSFEKNCFVSAPMHRIVMVTSSWLSDSIAARAIAPIDEFCCGVLCWKL